MGTPNVNYIEIFSCHDYAISFLDCFLFIAYLLLIYCLSIAYLFYCLILLLFSITDLDQGFKYIFLNDNKCKAGFGVAAQCFCWMA